jgi:membrane fusion protein, multidrug efflux system
MTTTSVTAVAPARTTTPASAPAPQPEQTPPPAKPKWQKYVTPLLVLLRAGTIVATITWKWNAWEGGKINQVTDDAYVRGDLTPLSTKVAGIVSDVKVSDYQAVHKGALIAELQDDDYKAQVAQGSAAVEAARAAIENNRRQRELQDAKIDRAFAGIDEAKAQMSAAPRPVLRRSRQR